jgi:hypothetical protein
MSKGTQANQDKSEVLQGTLDLMVLKILEALGPQHGYGIARRIEQVRTGSTIERRNGLYLSPAASAAEMDIFRVGSVGKQSQGEILFNHQKRS